MTHVKNYPFTFVGILFFFIGWFAVISGIFGFFRAEDLLIFSLKLESMILNVTYVPVAHIWFHMLIRIALGLFILIIGNAFLEKGIQQRRWMHPTFGDFRRLR